MLIIKSGCMYLEDIGFNGPEFTLDINDAKIFKPGLQLYTYASSLDQEGIDYEFLELK